MTIEQDDADPDEKSGIEKGLIRELAALLSETGLSEIEYERKGLRLRVARTIAATMVPTAAFHAAPQAAGASPGVAPKAEAADHPGTVKSPMVGTAYRSPEPGAPPFAEVGSKVTQGQTLLIIEAMKTMNHIRAPRAGTVSRILVENGQPVEFDQALLVIE
jgi:acetyl-CoA carboxylase biotin carboxyl carrier protein